MSHQICLPTNNHLIAGQHYSLLMVLSLLVLTGCQRATLFVPVSSPGEGGEKTSRYHVVQAGETLYSIAWRYGKDYRELASANQIAPPYTIYVDQRLSLAKSSRKERSKSVNTPGSAAITRKPQATKKKPLAVRQVTNIEWSWPIKGSILREFSLRQNLNKGIDIRGKLGQPVASAADGVVVYAGGGLRGFGKLIIVKHSQNYLSAYGHNRVLLVKEGEEVSGGQHVAEVGSNGSNQEMLHFEIRRNGKPENPLKYLPRL